MSTATKTRTRHCRRCHGSGLEPALGPTYTSEQSAILDRLGALGVERKAITDRKGYSTTPGRLRLDEIYAEVRTLIADGHARGIRGLDMIDALGVTSAAFYKRTGPYQVGP